jgi:hypothetical protein
MLVADEQWHTALFDLRRVFDGYLFTDDMGKRTIEQVFLVTPSRQEGPDRRVMYVDEVSFYSARPDSLTVTVDMPRDASGFGGLAWSLDNDPNGEPTGPVLKELFFVIAKPAELGRFLHVRAFDGAGNPGPAVTLTLFP